MAIKARAETPPNKVARPILFIVSLLERLRDRYRKEQALCQTQKY
jgi:hypothetical protein